MVTDYWKGSKTVHVRIVVLSISLLRNGEANHKKSQNICFPGQDLNQVPSECKSEVRFQV